MNIELPKFKNIQERDKYLIKNHEYLCYQKKNDFKEADVATIPFSILTTESTLKTADDTNIEEDEIKIRAVINTTNIMDSHKDVHVPGIWNRSIKENKRIKHIREHRSGFENIISDKDNLKVFTKTYSWRDLGLDKDGKTQALIFDSKVKKSRNAFMYKQYIDKNVDNHSVGMYYVRVKFALNTKEEDGKEMKEEYDKWIDKIINKKEVEKQGYFYVVYEAKIKEGSAVTDGSNPITPTVHSSKSEGIDTEEDKTLAKQKALSEVKEFFKTIKTN